MSIEDFRVAANVASAYATYTLEPLKLWDEDINATGNALNNTIIGNRGENVLNGLLHINYEAKPIISASFAIVKNRVQFARVIWKAHEVNGMSDESWSTTEDRQKFIFGSNTDAAAITCGDFDDHLYGMGGNDTLNGADGNDQLKGGNGVDVYQFTGTYGIDTITDTDGQGFITVDNTPIVGGKTLVEGIYYDADTHYIYALLGPEGHQSLYIRKEGDTGNQIIINNWSTDHNLNISFDAPDAAPDATLVGVDHSLINKTRNNNKWRIAA